MTDYIVPVSGGKDSQLVLRRALAKHRPIGDRVRAVHQGTNYDHPYTMKHLEYIEDRYEIKVEHTKSKYAGREEWELAVSDEVGKENIRQLVEIEDEFRNTGNKRKLIKIHPERDVKYLYEHGRFPEHQRRGLDTSTGCGLFCEPEES